MSNLQFDLSQVRKAYRLLYDYQARILDLVSYCGSKMKFSYNGGISKFSNVTPRNGKGNLGLWSWDWLNMYFYQFQFKEQMIHGNNLYFSIFLVSDSGYFEEGSNAEGKIDIDDFLSPEKSTTKLLFLVGKNGLKDMWEGWNSKKFVNQDLSIKEFDGGKMILKSFQLEDFIDEPTTINTLKQFQALCKNHDILFDIAESKLH